MFAQLGSTRFQGLFGFNEFTQGISINLAEHARIEGKPRLQKVGGNLTDLSVGILLHAGFCNPEAEFATLVSSCENAEVLPLIMGNGTYVGDFVIQSLERNVEHCDPSGNVVSQQLSLSLRESVNTDPVQKLAISARAGAYATSSGGATPLRIITPPKPSSGKSAMLDVSQARMISVAVDRDVTRASTFAAERPALSVQIGQHVTNTMSVMNSLSNKIAAPNLVGFAGTIPTAINAVISAALNLEAALPITTNINTVIGLAAAFQNAISTLTSSASLMAEAVAARKI